MNGRLQNKVAIITGGAKGIGLSTAKLFVKEGAKVMLVDIDEDALKLATKAINHPDLSYTYADVSKAEDVKRYVQETLSAFGRIDIFFNNAGIEGQVAPIAEYPDEEFDKLISINLRGVWLGCKYVIPKMNDSSSVIINSSVAGLKGFAGLGAYVASKHAIVGIMRVAAIENAARQIRVNSIHPGPVETEMMREIESKIDPSTPEAVKKNFESQIPFGRYADPTEIAELTMFLASQESVYMTGNTLVIDGGMICK